jgi:hypothetical protein
MHAFKYRVLVIACRTADSPELHKAMGTRCELGPAAFTLVVPRAGSGTATIQDLVDHLREAGFEVDGFDADADPIVAFQEAWDPGRFDEVIVSTLPTEASRWLQIDLPHRVARIADAPVTHVVAWSRAQAAAAAASRVMSG